VGVVAVAEHFGSNWLAMERNSNVAQDLVNLHCTADQYSKSMDQIAHTTHSELCIN
jgi:hypothetical protein